MPGQVKPVLGLAPTFKYIYEFVGKALAGSTKCRSYELDSNESDTLGKQSDDLMVEFFPNVQSRWIKLVIFAGSLIGIFGKKYLDHLEQIKKESPKPQANTSESNVNSDSSTVPTVLTLGQATPINPNKRF